MELSFSTQCKPGDSTHDVCAMLTGLRQHSCRVQGCDNISYALVSALVLISRMLITTFTNTEQLPYY